VSHLLPVAVTGDGFCEGVGDSVELENGDIGDPAIADLVEFGDVIYLRAVAIQNLEAAKAPAPGSAAAVASGGWKVAAAFLRKEFETPGLSEAWGWSTQITS
jgi:hypothetical protein